MYAKPIIAGLVVLGFLVCYAVGRSDGAKLEASANNALRAQEAIEFNLAIEGAYKRKAETEAKWQASFSAAGKDYQRKIDAAHTALVTAGAVRLFDPGTRAACGDPAAKVAADSKPTDPRGTELSAWLTDYLKREASRADKVVLKLNLCIDTLEAERSP